MRLVPRTVAPASGFDCRQAHPRSGVLLAVQSLEHGEQALFGTGLDADAVVDDGDLQPLGEEVAGDLDPGPVRTAELDRVGEQALEHERHLTALADHGRELAHAHLGSRGLDLRRQPRQRLVNEVT